MSNKEAGCRARLFAPNLSDEEEQEPSSPALASASLAAQPLQSPSLVKNPLSRPELGAKRSRPEKQAARAKKAGKFTAGDFVVDVPADLEAESAERRLEKLEGEMVKSSRLLNAQQHLLELLLAQNQRMASALDKIGQGLAVVHGRPSFHDPTAPAAIAKLGEVPGPKEENPRGMTIHELSTLRDGIVGCNCPKRLQDLCKIIDPAMPPGEVKINVNTLESKVAWKAWHYIIEGSGITEVLTQPEIRAAKRAQEAAVATVTQSGKRKESPGAQPPRWADASRPADQRRPLITEEEVQKRAQGLGICNDCLADAQVELEGLQKEEAAPPLVEEGNESLSDSASDDDEPPRAPLHPAFAAERKAASAGAGGPRHEGRP
jgi:hypothetical protein